MARWTVPLITAAARLRRRGLSYPAISVVLEDYHGFPVDPDSVRRTLRRHAGCPAVYRGDLTSEQRLQNFRRDAAA